MKFGVIGFGNIARKFVKSITYSNGHEVIAVAARSKEEAEDYLDKNKSVLFYNDYLELLENKDIEAVYIALPHKFHYHWSMEALKHNKSVLCEKPATLSVEEMKSLRSESKKRNVIFLEALKTKINHGYLQLLDDLKSIGKIESIESHFCFNATPIKGSGTYLFDQQQGGALNDVGSYMLGFTLKMINSPIVDIYTTSTVANGIDVHFNSVISFENGAKAYIEGAIDETKPRYAFIKGSNGVIFVPMFNRVTDYTIITNKQQVIERHIPLEGDDMTYQINVLAECACNKQYESSLHTLDDMVQIAEVTDRIREQIKR